MPSTIKTKLSAVPAKVPLVGDLVSGELALNVNDAILFMKKTVGGVDSIVRVGAEMSPAVAAALKETSGSAFLAALGGDGALEFIEQKTASGTQVEFTGLGAFRDAFFVGVGLTASAAAQRQMQVGSSGGYLSGSEYILPGTTPSAFLLSEAATAARSFSVAIFGFNKTMPLKPAISMSAGTNSVGVLSAAAFDRARFNLSAAGNYTGGTIYAFGRRG